MPQIKIVVNEENGDEENMETNTERKAYKKGYHMIYEIILNPLSSVYSINKQHIIGIMSKHEEAQMDQQSSTNVIRMVI